MPFSFPSSPTVGQTSTQNGRKYRYAGNNVWELDVGTGEDTALRAFFVPPAPTGLTATGGNAQASLSWTAPTVLAQTPITDYIVQFRLASESEWSTFADGTSTATSATVTGLTNGSAYVFRVAAVNGVGTGAYTSASSSVTPAAPTTDPSFSLVTVLLHFSGANGSTTFTDSSPLSLSLTANGNAQISTAKSRFGGSSALFDGTGDSVAGPTSDATRFSGDFTVEFWANVTAHKSFHVFFDCRTTVPSSTGFAMASNDAGQMTMFTSGGFAITGSTAFTANEWTHFALVRSGSVITLYQNGVSVGTATNTTNFTDGVFGLGISVADQNHSVNGNIDELRVTKAARYTSAFTPPTAAFPDA